MPNIILHITDLHVSDANEPNDFLRNDYYREYIGGLIRQIKENGFWPVNCVVATGDFVHLGKTVNFDHIKNIFSYIAKELNISENKIVVCPGSHDIIRDEDQQGNAIEARKAFAKFSRNYANGTPKKSDGRAIICDLSGGIYALMLDATLGSNGESRPGELALSEIDKIMTNCIVESGMGETDILIVGSHYPMIEFPGNVQAYEEEKWHERHYWLSAIPLRERITEYRVGKQTLWLYGDTHSPDHIMPLKGSYHVVTGRFGTTIARYSQISRQAKVIRIFDSADNLPEVLTLEVDMRTHKPQTQICRWNPVLGIIRNWTKLEPYSSEVHSATNSMDERKPSGIEEHLLSIAKEYKIDLLNVDLDKSLIDIIEEKGLYTLGRFHTSEDNISLSWISIGPLLNSTGVIASIIKQMDAWIMQILVQNPDINKANVVLLGMDCWGSVLASELSVVTGIKNYCVAARGRGAFHTEGELISEGVAKKLSEHKIIIFVCDVLATGHSIKYVYDDIQSKWKAMHLSPDNRWFCLSILMDERNARRADCAFIETFGTTCKNLRMPVVAKEELPNASILPPTISFS